MTWCDVCMYVFMYVCIHMYVCVCMYVCMCVDGYAYLKARKLDDVV